MYNSFDSFAGNNDVVFNRNGVEFFRLGTGYSTSNGAPTNLLNVDSSTGVSSGWLFANVFANRIDNTNTEFRGAISGVVVGVKFICCMSMLMKIYISIPMLN